MVLVGLLEDNMRIAKLCSTMLQYAGHRVIVYEHPQSCLDALLPTQEQDTVQVVRRPSLLPDVLIIDLHLPDISGLEVLRSLRAYDHTRSIPLIVCTAATLAEIDQVLQEAPRARLIEKPFTYQALMLAIQWAVQELRA